MGLLINAYCTCRELPPPQFLHRPVGRRDRGDPELAPHLNGFINYVLGRGGQKMTATKYSLMRHIERVAHHLSVDVEEPSFDAFADWAWQANAICFLPDGSVRDPSLRLLIDAKGAEKDGDAQVPHPRDAVERKARSERELQALGVRTAATLPPVIAEVEVECRPAGEVATRALALFAAAVRAESLAAKQEIAVGRLESKLPIAFKALTPKERAFLGTSSPDDQQVTDFCWRYEALNVLLWSVGAVPELRPAFAIADVPLIARTMPSGDERPFIDAATLRPISEILDALDLIYRLHWAVRQSRLDGKPAGAGLDSSLAASIVMERHVALNWLVRFEDAAWDDVDTPT